MCGILGIISKNNIADFGTFSRALNLMGHRGPDHSSVWYNESRNIYLGHRRLSIVDLDSRSNQPYERLDLGLVIVFNGEIYNHRELKTSLINEGQIFYTSSDTEVLVVAYKIWGVSMLQKIRGMFSFMIFDKINSTFFGARDRSGEKPFYYKQISDGIAFSSEIKSLFVLPQIEKRVNLDALDFLLAYGYTPRNQSIIEGIFKLLPGNYIKYDIVKNKIEVQQYWRPPSFIENQYSINELTDELHNLLIESVSEQLEADVPVGVLLSGGVDSSLVTAVAAETGKKIRTFNVGFPQKSQYDESKFALQIADYFGTEHYQLDIEEVDFELMFQLARQFDDPIFDSSMIPTYLVTKLVKKHCTVALGGDAGDELFGGYRWYNDLNNKAKQLKSLPSWISPIGDSFIEGLGYAEHHKRFWLESIFSKSQLLPITPGYFSKSERNKLFPCLKQLNTRSEQSLFREKFEGHDFVDKFTRMDFIHYMPDDILVKVDRSSMLNSLEMRAPFLDSRIIDFAFAKVPSNFKADGTSRKILLKSLSQKILPPEFDSDRKQGFAVPVKEWLTKGHWKSNYLDVINQSTNKNFKRFALNESDGIKRNALLMLQLWINEYKIEID